MSHNGLTRVVARLEADGLITRTRDEHDGRVVHAALTPEGLSALRAANQAHLARIRGAVPGPAQRRAAAAAPARSGTRSIRRSSPAASAHQTVAAGPVRLAQLVLEQLPGAGLGERLVAQVDRARDLEAGRASRGSGREAPPVPRRGPRRPRGRPRPSARRGRRTRRPRRPPGGCSSTASTSSEYTFSPPVMIMSFARSTQVEVAVLVRVRDVAGAVPAVDAAPRRSPRGGSSSRA